MVPKTIESRDRSGALAPAVSDRHLTIESVPDNSDNTFVTLAQLLRPQGRKGELLADLRTDFPEQLTTAAGVFLVLQGASAPAPAAARIVIENQWMPTGKNAGRIVVKLPGCDSISDAEKLAGFTLMLPSSERPVLADDTFYVSDLIGSTLFNGDTEAGKVVDVEFATSPDGRTRLAEAAPLLCILPNGAPQDSEPILIPFVRAHLRSVDLAARRIVMDLPEGLLDS